MSGENWSALGGEQFKGSPQDFKNLANYWRDAADALSGVQKPSSEALGNSAKNFDAAMGETESAFTKAQQGCDELERLCSAWAAELESLQKLASDLAKQAGAAQESISSSQKQLEGLSRKENKDSATEGKQKSLQEAVSNAQLDLAMARSVFSNLKISYDFQVNSFKGAYHSPEFISISATTNSQSPLGRQIASWIGGLQSAHPDKAGILNFADSVLPFQGDGTVKASFFYNDLLFAGIGGVEKALSSFRLGLGAGSGAGKSTALSKMFGFADNIYFPNPIKEKVKIASGFVGSKLKGKDLEGFFKKCLEANAKNLDRGTRRLMGNTNELAAGMAESVRGVFSKYSLPISALNKDFKKMGDSKNVIAANAKYLSENVGGKVGAFAKHMPMVAKVSKRIPLVGNLISGATNYSEYYKDDKHQSSSEGEKRARAVGASLATTGTGMVAGAASGAALGATLGSVVPGLGTAVGGVVGGIIGGVVGGWTGEEAAKKVGFDDYAADKFGQIFNAVKG
ncbi:hypothetical protein ACN082_04930 [Rothia sp. CCM 9417]|uniref:hypothetical protein n=1 Tax=Rothia sp. CCM 9417 TaxID=3402657 RepID=UPI003ADF3E66